ncbi:MAG: hypothetical protein U0230_00890 [Polyangiales bacterium]
MVETLAFVGFAAAAVLCMAAAKSLDDGERDRDRARVGRRRRVPSAYDLDSGAIALDAPSPSERGKRPGGPSSYPPP